ncbi:hypothetical protein FXV77_20705 [Sphingobacterium phlebotomi]|uniref:Uncharacterized protein n=1 Tax=Sphingobacterium phlebotomi TaxID=2605433 RepID=A0A5D4GSD4_9SPHI|nr:hypothetical protein [Sphingobacterium phlebotomi]TYR31666.1 hypothetical protein FXV77_20705 [Sphingobacterium phlebotomi]
MDNKDAIFVLVNDNYPKDCYNFIEDDFKNSPLNVNIQRRENGAMAGIEWALPTAIVVYLLKPFFEAFLKEAGKDAYQKAKGAIKKLVSKNLPVKTNILYAGKTIDKQSKKYDQSLTISIKAALHSNLTLVVLFNNELVNEDCDLMTDGLLESIENMYKYVQQEFPDKDDNDKLSQNQLYLIANMESGTWDILTQQQMTEKYRNS